MKKISKILMLFILLFGLVVMPSKINATEDYYAENEDQAIIYLFRGKNCGYCRAFLTFLNDIVPEYGKYFKMVSYEIWHNEDNAKLYTEVAEYLGEDSGGVPFIIIGDKKFGGYSEEYDSSIKQAIVDLYNTNKKDRYDVFEKMKLDSHDENYVTLNFKETLQDEDMELKYPADNQNNSSVIAMIICNLVFIIAACFIVVSTINAKHDELMTEIKKINNKEEKIENKKE